MRLMQKASRLAAVDVMMVWDRKSYGFTCLLVWATVMSPWFTQKPIDVAAYLYIVL